MVLEFFKIQNDPRNRAFFLYSLSIYLHLSHLIVASFDQQFRSVGDIFYWLTSKVGDRYARNPLVFAHVHLAYSSMCSISPRGIHGRLLDGGIDVKGHFDRKCFYSRTEWTRRSIRSSSTVLLVVRSRSVSA